MTTVATTAVSDGNQGTSGANGANTQPQNDSGADDWRERLLAQRKADQARAATAERERDELKAQLESEQSAKLAEQKRFQDLYEAEKKKREETDKKLSEMTAAQVTAAKTAALNAALGGVKKSEYLRFADLSRIAVNADGTVDEDSVKEVAAKFRESHPDLLAAKQTSKLPNDAGGNVQSAQSKPLADMTHAELAALLAAAKK